MYVAMFFSTSFISVIAVAINASVVCNINVDSAGIALVRTAICYAARSRCDLTAVAPRAPGTHLTTSVCCGSFWRPGSGYQSLIEAHSPFQTYTSHIVDIWSGQMTVLS